MDLSSVPLEVLELILSHLTDPVSQRRLAQVRTMPLSYSDTSNTGMLSCFVVFSQTSAHRDRLFRFDTTLSLLSNSVVSIGHSALV